MNDSILIIGPPNSGKTTFIIQFFTRVKKRKSSIVLSKTPENIKAISDAVNRLAMGEEPTTTSADENVEIVLPLNVDGKEIELVCHDYGGEQVNDITELMEIDDHWVKLLNSSDRWILFIRPHEISPEYDLSISGYENLIAEKSKGIKNPGLSEQSRFIELLQSLLYIKRKGVKRSIETPSLSIALTCWDELKTNEKPIVVLREKLPMLLHFIQTIWEKESFNVFGLSPQEFPLDTPEAKDKYQNELPENFGYMIDENGERDNDITKLVEKSLRL